MGASLLHWNACPHTWPNWDTPTRCPGTVLALNNRSTECSPSLQASHPHRESSKEALILPRRAQWEEPAPALVLRSSVRTATPSPQPQALGLRPPNSRRSGQRPVMSGRLFCAFPPRPATTVLSAENLGNRNAPAYLHQLPSETGALGAGPLRRARAHVQTCSPDPGSPPSTDRGGGVGKPAQQLSAPDPEPSPSPGAASALPCALSPSPALVPSAPPPQAPRTQPRADRPSPGLGPGCAPSPRADRSLPWLGHPLRALTLSGIAPGPGLAHSSSRWTH